NTFTQKGYVVLFVPETATELIGGGVAPWTCGTNEEYQKIQVSLQIEKEKLFKQAAESMKEEKILIVCDRGILDNKAYMNEEEYAHVLDYVSLTEEEALNQYEAVFHLESAAKGAVSFYTSANNAARYETVDEAAALDDRLLNCWKDHPRLYVIDNSTGFSEKMKKLLKKMSICLNEEPPYENRRKFLIKNFDISLISEFTKVDHEQIIQTYLLSDPHSEVRIRQILYNNQFSYMQSSKQILDDGDVVVKEKRLSAKEYYDLLAYEDLSMYTLYRDRYKFIYDDLFCEIDRFTFWDDQMIIKVKSIEDLSQPHLPDFIEIIKEITEDPHYKNKALSTLYMET
ncbi:MAG: AAA family ATPase, partial [bacterium]